MSMEQLEVIVALFTFGGVCLTAVKVLRSHTKWYWNLAPMLVGFTACLWVAKIFA
jgi:hypothetical protein